MPTYIGLVRGINVGGNNVVKMANLRFELERRGFENVRTLLQSGNVVFESSLAESDNVETMLREIMSERFHVNAPWHVRTTPEWQTIIAQNPFPIEAQQDPGHLLVCCLKTPPEPDGFAAVKRAISGPERIVAIGRDVYMLYPDRIGDSKVDRTTGWKAIFEGGTARNWNTVLKLESMAATEKP